MVTLKFKLLDASAQIPTYAHLGDAAFDIYSSEETVLKKGETKPIKTSVACEIPQGYFVSFRGRSGLAVKSAIDVFGGVVDANYRGEWMVILSNQGKKDYHIEKGERIAQGLVQPVLKVKIKEVKKLSETERGEKGFGSSGRK